MRSVHEKSERLTEGHCSCVTAVIAALGFRVAAQMLVLKQADGNSERWLAVSTLETRQFQDESGLLCLSVVRKKSMPVAPKYHGL